MYCSRGSKFFFTRLVFLPFWRRRMFVVLLFWHRVRRRTIHSVLWFVRTTCFPRSFSTLTVFITVLSDFFTFCCATTKTRATKLNVTQNGIQNGMCRWIMIISALLTSCMFTAATTSARSWWRLFDRIRATSRFGFGTILRGFDLAEST